MSVAMPRAAQVKLLTDALCQCIERGRAAAQLPEARRRTVIEPLAERFLGEDGTLDLNGIWGALLREPGVTERALASAFAALEDLEGLLGVGLRRTRRLEALTPAQRQALLRECQVPRPAIERLVRHSRIEAQLAS